MIAESDRNGRGFLLTALTCLAAIGLLLPGAAAGPREQARDIYRTTGVRGGLVVHVGCGDGRLTEALQRGDRYLVHGLTTDQNEVRKARSRLASKGTYGDVSVERWNGETLPHADNLVNLLLVEKRRDLSRKEMMRALAPGGIACLKDGDGWKQLSSPWPSEIDEWTHYLHDASNNAVAQDSRVKPPRHLKWKSGPMWSRGHEFNSSVAAIVSSGGRMFYIIDRGTMGMHSEKWPSRWFLVARDAFNGVKLWERRMGNWSPYEWGNVGFRSNPQVLPRRLVSRGDRLFVTLSYRGPLVMMRASTGDILKKWENTRETHEIVCRDGTVILRVRRPQQGNPRRQSWEAADELVMALDGDTGELLWEKQVDGSMVPLSLSVSNGKVCYHNYSEIVSLDLKTGKESWRSPCRARSNARSPADGRWHIPNLGTLLIYKDTVFFSAPDGLRAFSLADGEKLWTGPRVGAIAPTQPVGLFGAQGLIWPTGAPGAIKGTKVTMKGYDPRSGEMKRRISVDRLFSPGHHVRCYRSKATERFLLLPKRGVEFVDLEGTSHRRHDWLRAPCSYGALPANGLLYMPPHQCFCFPGVLLTGFNALSAEADGPQPDHEPAHPLRRGPAWGTEPGEKIDMTIDWPTYRHDRLRSGHIECEVPAELKPLWKKSMTEGLTAPVEAESSLYLAEEEAHTLHCLDAETGEEQWSFVAGGPIDSPPTVYRGLVLFGCTDGWVYCLRASDGQMVWRFRAAPHRRRLNAFGNLESAWPAHGSVLVQDGIVYTTAGRSSFLDGGIRLFGLDPETGKIVHKTRIRSERPDPYDDTGRTHAMEGAKSDILVSDGTDLYLYQKRFNPDLSHAEAPYGSEMRNQRNGLLGDRIMGLHLMSTRGFLDDTWFNRTFWSYSRRWPGFYYSQFAPKAGQILVFDEDYTYGVHVFRMREGWSPVFQPDNMTFELFSDANSNEPRLLDKPANEVMSKEELQGQPRGNMPATGVEKGIGFTRSAPPRWSREVGVRFNAMTLAGDRLFAAGSPHARPPEKVPPEEREKSNLWVISTEDGSTLAEYTLDHPPDFDGLIAARGRLYLVTVDDHLICLGSN